MTMAIDSSTMLGTADTKTQTRVGNLAVAGFASLGAGAIHAAAVGVHNEHSQAVRVFVVTALFQLAWGALAQRRTSKTLALAGIIGNGALIVGWAMAKAGGISFVDGLEAKEAVQFADGLAAAFAIVAVLGALITLMRPKALAVRSVIGSVAALAIAGLTLPGMVAAGSHGHAGTDGHGTTDAHGGTAAGDTAHAAHPTDATAGDATAPLAATDTATADDGHAHPTETSVGQASATPAAGAGAGDDGSHTDHVTPARPATKYDPTKPLDFGGVEGVTPEQQAEAENLVAITLLRLPKFSDPAVAESLGWKSIGDGLTGVEHYINWELINDDDYLNPDMPESLVYDVSGGNGSKKLVSAMFMLPDSVPLTEVPDMGGALMQWHIHDNLCFSQGDHPTVAGITTASAGCPEGLTKFKPAPMIHVWITKHPCGPFAALEGIGAGTIAEGEERLCDTVHGH
jgi:hypothetical protein